MFFQKLWSTPI